MTELYKLYFFVTIIISYSLAHLVETHLKSFHVLGLPMEKPPFILLPWISWPEILQDKIKNDDVSNLFKWRHVEDFYVYDV